MKLLEIESEIEKRLNLVCPGSFYERYSSTIKGNKKIRGQHVTVYMPLSFRPVKKLRSIERIFKELYGPIKKAIAHKGTVNMLDGGIWRTVSFDIKSPQEAR